MAARRLTVSCLAERSYIRIGGKWVETAGFMPTDSIIVSNPEKGVLHIENEQRMQQPCNYTDTKEGVNSCLVH